ncbi:putative dolichyl pyrophosphate Man9GlcNAc2 alpha-1,3-glucosyltransferase [Cocos nucifera]|uniref:Alpha-1,3-glucosyltransferase n=1 Tax=Cocos nucifera TaxID=13894 RepID=A0A8K0IYL2_COCNU|nr:putative dolichyl pyrophosphate Man9GlcNAc2 alpha-1,3-glucosyltransferase [Cocos nucifera]
MAKKAKRTTPADDDGGFPWSTTALTAPTAGAVALFALLVRVMVSVGPYSGEGTPPKYGDYEAQRHWMEITLHTPASEWYRNTSVNDLAYWGLDYPPLTAYQSLGHALLLNASLPTAVALSLSRGFESPALKLLMRWTVLSSDLLVFFPAALYFVWVYCRRNIGGDKEGRSAPWLLAMILLNPCLILIDHGHFQMSLYFAPAFFSHLLGKCLRHQNPIFEVMKLGLVVIGTFALVWQPYLYSLEAVMEVKARFLILLTSLLVNVSSMFSP